MSESSSVHRKTRKSAWLIVVIVLTVSISGFSMGLRQSHSESTRPSIATPYEALSGETAYEAIDGRLVVPAVPYGNIQNANFRPNDQWTNDLANLHSKLLVSTQGEEDRRFLRMERRAYDGAPPVVPHPIDQHNATSCLSCHAKATVIGEVIAPAISHPAYTSCTQCHVSSKGLGSRWDLAALDLHTDNQFAGYNQPQLGQRAYPDSPPTIPHTLRMRQNCLSCHGQQGTSPIRTTHPERQSCTQCHVPSFDVEAQNFSESPFPLTPEVLPRD